jgi:hypothetical protein
MTDMREHLAAIIADEENGGDPYDIADAIIAALPGMVKPLEWVTAGSGKVAHTWSSIGFYAVYKCSGRFEGLWNPCLGGRGVSRDNPEKTVISEERGRIVCEAHYTAQIMAAFGIVESE